jgi:hypothetical protein
MEATFAEYEEWSEHPIPELVIQNYNKALQQLEKYKPYEEALVSFDCFSSRFSTNISLINSCKLNNMTEVCFIVNIECINVYIQFTF